MKGTKKLVAVLLCAVMVFGVAACAQQQPEPAGDVSSAPASSSTDTPSAPPEQEERITITFSLWGDPAEQENKAWLQRQQDEYM